MLIRGLAHGKHANFIAVFFPEQSHRARSNGVIRGHKPCRYRFITPYLTVNIRFNGRDLVWRQRLGMGEVEEQTVRSNETEQKSTRLNSSNSCEASLRSFAITKRQKRQN